MIAFLFGVRPSSAALGAAEWLYERFAPLLGRGWRRQAGVFSLLAVLGSNLVSNVPFILVARPWIETLPNPVLQWRVLAMATTFAGNLTLLAWVANLIVVEAAGGEGPFGFWEYLRIGLPVTAATMAWELLVLLFMGC